MQTNLDEMAFRRAFHDAGSLLRRHVDALNAINVYPVPDGDTGTNMSLTLQAALEAMDGTPTRSSVLHASQSLARGALMGARGNSGVILSQVLRGLSEGLAGEKLGGPEAARALRSAQDAAYSALSEPKEGTMLSAIRAAAEALDGRQPESAGEALSVAARAAFDAVERTPDQLPVLKEAGVVDAGALGLAILLDGLRRSVTGDSLDVDLTPEIDLSGPWRNDAASLHRVEHGDSGYCTEFLVAGRDLESGNVRLALKDLGTSLLVVGQADLLRVHIHTTRPDDVLAFGRSLGEVTRTKVDNLEAQIESFAASRPEAEIEGKVVSVVAVASGGGIEQAFRSLGVDVVIAGGQTMNPSAGEILQGIESAPAESVVVLPNNKNIVSAAQQAARESKKTVVVVESKSIPQGIAAAVTLSPDESLQDNKALMEHSLASVRSGEVTRAVRATSVDGRDVRVGDVIGLVDGDLRVAAGAVDEAVRKTIEAMSSADGSLLTLYAGHDVSDDDAERLAASLRDEHTTLEVELVRGGQPHYLYLISLE
jgi:uncharacterized protein